MEGKGKNLSVIKEKNSSLVRETIYRFSPLSRAAVAQRLSLANATITSNVAELIKRGLVREIESPQTGGDKPLGRPPILLDFITDARYVAGIELGPYETSMVITDLRGNVRYHCSEIFAETDYTKMVKTLTASIKKLLSGGNISKSKIAGIGIGLPGFVDGQAGIVHSNLRQDWEARSLVQDLQKELPFPICIENNVRARTTGADLFRRQANGDPLLYYFVSYGIACTLMVNRQVISGKAAGAGEAGHMIVEIGGPRCDVCGNLGCLDAFASEHAILKRVRSAVDTGISAVLKKIVKMNGALTMQEVLQAQICGDPVVASILHDSIRYIAVNLANLMNFISPESILVDGRIFSVAENREQFLSILPKNVFGGHQKGYQLQFIDYDPLGGAKGAAATAVKRFILDV